MRQLYDKYFQIVFKDENMENKYRDTFLLDNQKNIGTFSICAVVFCLMNFWIFLHLILETDYSLLPVIKMQAYLTLATCSVWILYTAISYFIFLKMERSTISNKGTIAIIAIHYSFLTL